MEKALTALIIPHVQLKDATFDSTLEYLKQTAEKASGGKTKVSFVVQVPEDVATKTKVSIDLADIPFTEVLHYLSELTGFKFTIEKYAITVKMPSGSRGLGGQRHGGRHGPGHERADHEVIYIGRV